MVNVRKYTIYESYGIKYVGKNYVNQTSDFVQNGGLVMFHKNQTCLTLESHPHPKKMDGFPLK